MDYIYTLVFVYMSYVAVFLKITPTAKLDAIAGIISTRDWRIWLREWRSVLVFISLLPTIVIVGPLFILGLFWVVVLEFWLFDRYMTKRD